MPGFIVVYIRIVDRFNRIVGRFAMYLIFAMMGVLLYSSFTKTFFIPPLWTLESAQFLMVGYYILGGAYSLQMGDHVRMDLLYGAWSDKTKAWVDCFTVLLLIFYLGVLLYGGYNSTAYAIEYGERSYSAWRPYMAPIKIVMCLGILMMLLQAIASMFRSICKVRGVDL
ncbi:TRAP transporter small permease subunit [Hoeflea sp. CAU 1731]